MEDSTIWVLGSTDVSLLERINNDLRSAIEIICFDKIAGGGLHLGLCDDATSKPFMALKRFRSFEKYLANHHSFTAWFIENVVMITTCDGRLIKLKSDSGFGHNGFLFKLGPDLAWPLVSNKTAT